MESVMEEKRRIMMKVAYDGTSYSGYAVQDGKTTIEGTLNSVLSEITGETVEVIGASRTDAGVHAYGNLAVFDTASPIPAERFARVLNSRLPGDIRIVSSCETASDFHPRRAGLIKSYEYRILNSRIPDPMTRLYTYQYSFELDPEAMNEAAAYLVGEHDFTSFCNPASQAETRVRDITECRVACRQPDNITIYVSGHGFLYHMVRIITGTLLEVGRGFRTPASVRDILEARDRRAAGFTAPPQGLFLMGYDL